MQEGESIVSDVDVKECFVAISVRRVGVFRCEFSRDILNSKDNKYEVYQRNKNSLADPSIQVVRCLQIFLLGRRCERFKV